MWHPQGRISAWSASVFQPYENILTPVPLHQVINFGLLPVKTVLGSFLLDFCEQEQFAGKGGKESSCLLMPVQIYVFGLSKTWNYSLSSLRPPAPHTERGEGIR